MKLKTALGILFILELFSPTLFAANFRCGFLKRKVETTLSIPRPPDVLILARNVRVAVDKTPRSFNRSDENRVRQAVERALSPDFSIVNGNPEAVFRIFVDSVEPSIEQYMKTERRRIVVGQDCTTDKNGKERCVDKYEQKDVPVRYWEADVRMNWRVEVVDSSETPIDSAFSSTESYKSKKEVSVNGVAQPGSAKLPDEREIVNQMFNGVAEKITVRYRKTYDNLTVDLACSDELTPGNKLVEDSNTVRIKNWEGALKLWEAAKMKKKENEGDRLYNMAVAYEALAFMAFDASGRPEDAAGQFDMALELYQQAATVDPGEKYIQRAAERLTISKNNLGRAKLHEIFKEREERLSEQEKLFAQMEDEERQLREEAQREAMARPLADDTAEERNFRTYARARLGNQAVVSDEELENIVSSYGLERFKLDENQAWRVMYYEIARKDDIVEYGKEFELFVAKGFITRDDRNALNAIAESFLFLTAEDIRIVESSFTFRDESASKP